MNVPREDQMPHIDTSKVHLVFLFNAGTAKLATFDSTAKPLSDVLQEVSKHCPDDVNSPELAAVVVIDGLQADHLYTAGMFRWLAGVGPDPQRRDPSWMG